MPSYNNYDRRIELSATTDFVALQCARDAAAFMDAALANEGVEPEHVLTCRDTRIAIVRQPRASRLAHGSESIRLRPVFSMVDGSLLVPDGSVLADLRALDASTIERLMRWSRVKIDSYPTRIEPRHRLIPPGDPFEFANLLAVEHGIAAEPSFRILLPSHVAHVVCRKQTGPSYPWALDAIGIQDAWRITRGDRRVTTALLDVGVDMDHHQLVHCWVDGYDVIGDDDEPEPSLNAPMNKAHGTACAGLIAARGENRFGIVGVAPQSCIAPYRWCRWHPSSKKFLEAPSAALAQCIQDACRRGIRIICIPYVWSREFESVYSDIKSAIREAVHEHRCVVIAAGGNHGGPLAFPACLPDVIAVVASNQNDRPCDERDWESGRANFDGGEWIAAPGVRVWTTDIMGPGGYNDSGGKEPVDLEYTTQFGGSSAAAALVAGVVALMLSTNPALEQSEIRDILRQTSDPMRQTIPAMGRIHAGRAVAEAARRYSTKGTR